VLLGAIGGVAILFRDRFQRLDLRAELLGMAGAVKCLRQEE
jgi:hypothetical protein